MNKNISAIPYWTDAAEMLFFSYTSDTLSGSLSTNSCAGTAEDNCEDTTDIPGKKELFFFFSQLRDQHNYMLDSYEGFVKVHVRSSILLKWDTKSD